MLKISKLLILTLLIVFFTSTIPAEEGMWMPHQMKNLNLKTLGLKMDPNDLYKKDGTGLMSAVVGLGGGTGEFVSKQGLILTNHHVAFGAIQRASDKEHDYITHGFLAKTNQLEIPARGYIADVLLGYEEITALVTKKLKKNMTPIKRFKALDRISKQIIAKEEKKAKDLYCVVRSMYSGNKYYLFRFKRLRDVRLVYAPPMSLGNFGGDIDNWMWPRHTNDFSYLRAYVSKDNVGTTYNKENVPYKPKAFLKISLDGLKENDFNFIMGYPGRTYRNYTYSQLKDSTGEMDTRIKYYQDLINFYEEAGKGDRAIQIKYSSIIKGLNNGMKNRQGKLEGLEKSGVLAKKKKVEQKFMQWVAEQPERKKKYGDILAKIESFLKENAAFYDKSRKLGGLTSGYFGPKTFSMAYTIYRNAMERVKPDIKRDSQYQERRQSYLKQGLKLADRRFNPQVDKKYMKFLMKRLNQMDNAQHPQVLKAVFEKGDEGINSYVEQLYSTSVLKDPKKRLELFNLKPKQLLKRNEPFIMLAVEMEKELKAIREKKKALDQQLQDLTKVFKAALLEKHQGNLAPDANSSIRFTYGTVKSYKPKDAVTYLPFTTLKGVMEKETGKEPFIVPQKLKDLYKARDFGRYEDKQLKDVVTCFLNTTNITGGNSGSAVLNAKGEQVGIVFDMTYESVIGDYFIIPELQRAVSVDIRYVMFVTEKFSGAHHLIKEMGL